jgi:ATP-dependent DNA helicase RecQ
LAERLARRLDLPLHAVLRKTRDTPPQAEMQNSAQQYENLAGAFEIDAALIDRTGAGAGIPDGPVFLVDDFADSRWTLSVTGARLRKAGSGPVYPLVLAIGSTGD